MIPGTSEGSPPVSPPRSAVGAPLRYKEGDVLDGRYVVECPLGQGTSGLVLLCRDRMLGGLKVALKLVPQSICARPVAAARFAREVRAGFRVRHSNVVRIYDLVWTSEILGYTMEALEAGSVQALLEQTGPLPQERVGDILLQVSSGLTALHAAGIIHRDLKPANVFVDRDGLVKIGDLGVAYFGPQQGTPLLVTDSTMSKRLTSRGDIVGTPEYISPEYIESGSVDERSDLYALGVIGYELLTGNLPFQGKTVLEQLTARVGGSPTPLEHWGVDAEQPVARLVMQLLSRAPEHRPQSAHETSRALRDFIHQKRSSHAMSGTHSESIPAIENPADLRRDNRVTASIRFYVDILSGCFGRGRFIPNLMGGFVDGIGRRSRSAVDLWDGLSPVQLFLVLLVASLLIGLGTGTIKSSQFGLFTTSLTEQAPERSVLKNWLDRASPKDTASKSRYFAPKSSNSPIVRSLPEASAAEKR